MCTESCRPSRSPAASACRRRTGRGARRTRRRAATRGSDGGPCAGMNATVMGRRLSVARPLTPRGGAGRRRAGPAAPSSAAVPPQDRPRRVSRARSPRPPPCRATPFSGSDDADAAADHPGQLEHRLGAGEGGRPHLLRHVPLDQRVQGQLRQRLREARDGAAARRPSTAAEEQRGDDRAPPATSASTVAMISSGAAGPAARRPPPCRARSRRPPRRPRCPARRRRSARRAGARAAGRPGRRSGSRRGRAAPRSPAGACSTEEPTVRSPGCGLGGPARLRAAPPRRRRAGAPCVSPLAESTLCGSEKAQERAARRRSRTRRRAATAARSGAAPPPIGAATPVASSPASVTRELALTSEKPGGSSRGTTALRTTPYALEATSTPERRRIQLEAAGGDRARHRPGEHRAGQHRAAIAARRPCGSRSSSGPITGASSVKGAMVIGR